MMKSLLPKGFTSYFINIILYYVVIVKDCYVEVIGGINQEERGRGVCFPERERDYHPERKSG